MSHSLLTPDDLDALCRVAHGLWCDRMRSEGWTHGNRFDEGTQTHDALRPFGDLSETDRDALKRGLSDDTVMQCLAGAVVYPRGPSRPFTPAELHVGLRVGLADVSGDPDRDSPLGTVTGWELDDSGSLVTIEVDWDDGEHTTHANAEGELARLDDAQT